jgi:hypothetical protein
MTTVEQMAGYAAHLNANTAIESKGKPVSEICIFKLKPEYIQDHAGAGAEFESQVIANCKPGLAHSKGIRRVGWGFSVDDPEFCVYIVDWDKIEDHWDFWLDAGFPPVMAAIEKLFVPGRPLVRHYNFGGAGSLGEELAYVRIIVWDNGEEGKREDQALARENANSNAVDFRQGYAVDLGEATWWCSMLGYKTKTDAFADEVKEGKDAVSHVYKCQYID